MRNHLIGKKKNGSHVRFDDLSPSIVEGEIGDEHIDDNLDFDDRESHSNAGLREYEISRACNDRAAGVAYPGSSGE